MMSPPKTMGRQQPQRSGSAPQGTTLDPIRVLRQNVSGIIVSVAVGAVASVVFFFGSLYIYPLFESQSVFGIRNRLEDARDVKAADFADAETVERIATEESKRIVSRPLLKKAIEGETSVLNTKWIAGYLEDDGLPNWEDATDDLKKELRSGHIRGTQYFYLAWRAHTEEDVIAVLHAIENEYLENRRLDENEEITGNRGIFVKQKNVADTATMETQAEIVKLIGDRSLESFDENAQQALGTLEDIELRINATAEAIQRFKNREAIANAKLAAEAGWSEEDRSIVQRDPVIQELRVAASNSRTQLAAAQAKYGDRHHIVEQLNRTANAASSEYNAEIERAMRNYVQGERDQVKNELAGLQSVQNDNLEKQVAERALLNAAAKANSQLTELRDKKTRLEEESKDLATRIGDIDLVTARTDAQSVRRVESAIRPRELWFPKAKIVLPGVTFLIVALYIGLVFVIELTDRRVRFPTDLLGLPGGGRLLGVIPDAEHDPEAPEDLARAAVIAPSSALTESIRQAFGQSLRMIGDKNHVVIAFVAPMPGFGVTTVVSNMAILAKSIGRRVLVIDTNFRRPMLASSLGVSNDAPGLCDALGGGITPESCIQSSPDGVDVLSAGTPDRRKFEFLYTAQFVAVIASLKERYDVVLLDCPPTIVAGETAVVAQSADATVLLARAYAVEKGLVMKTAGQLADLGNQFLGAILFANRTTAGGYQQKNVKLMSDYSAPRAPAESSAA
ncbi:MAG: AAA family ATPase [Planctomycetota bacterium]|nr:AAA family ATPase [Planctomycetota bacterium]